MTATTAAPPAAATHRQTRRGPTAFGSTRVRVGGIRSKLREVVNDFNFGVVQVLPTGAGAEIVTTLAHQGNATAWGVDVAALVR